MQCERRRKVLRLNHKPQRHPKCPFKRALYIIKDTEVVVKGAELPIVCLSKKGRQTQSQGKGQCDNKLFSQQFGISFANTRFRLQNVHPFIKNLFQGIKIPQVPLAGRLKSFLKSREKLTRDPNILGITQGFQIPFKRKPSQKSKSLREIGMFKDQTILVNEEISDMLRKGPIMECQPHPNQFVSALF